MRFYVLDDNDQPRRTGMVEEDVVYFANRFETLNFFVYGETPDSLSNAREIGR